MTADSAVEWKRGLRLRLPLERAEEGGWLPLTDVYAEVAKEQIDGQEVLLLTIDGERYTLTGEVMEALYDLHQNIPR